LLLCDAGALGPAWTVAQVASAVGVTSRTIEHIKKRFIEEGLEAALERKKRETPPRQVIFDGEFEARIVALACSEAPEGHARWTLKLLADKAVELNFASSVSAMTIHRILKKRTYRGSSELVLENPAATKCRICSGNGRCSFRISFAV